MGLNVFAAMPIPAGDGIGAAVSVVGQGLKTFVVGGVFEATVIIEGGIGGRFSPLFRLDKPEQFRGVPCVVDQVRIQIVNFRSGAPIAFVGGAPAVNTFGALVVPAANGVGAALDTSLFGEQKTIAAGGTFDATLTYEVGEDVSGPFAVLARVDKTSNLVNATIVSRFVRVRVTNFVSGVPSVGIGGADLQNAENGPPVYNVRGPFTAAPVPPTDLGDLIEVDPSIAARFAVLLPAITPANRGGTIIIKNVVASANPVDVTTTGADTIDITAALIMNIPKQSVAVVSDGVSNWDII